MTASPSASPRSSQSPSRSSRGAYWAMTLMTCVAIGLRRRRASDRRATGWSPRRSASRSGAPVLGGVEGTLDGIDAGRDDDPTPQRARVVACGRKVGVPGEDEVDLGDHARLADVAGAPAHRRPDRDRIDELDQGPSGIGARNHRACLDGLAGCRARRPSPDRRPCSRRRPRPRSGSRRRQLARRRPARPPGRPARHAHRSSRRRRRLRCRHRRSAGPPSSRPTRDRGARSARPARRWLPGGRRSRRPQPRSRRRPWAGPAASVRASSLPRPR